MGSNEIDLSAHSGDNAPTVGGNGRERDQQGCRYISQKTTHQLRARIGVNEIV